MPVPGFILVAPPDRKSKAHARHRSRARLGRTDEIAVGQRDHVALILGAEPAHQPEPPVDTWGPIERSGPPVLIGLMPMLVGAPTIAMRRSMRLSLQERFQRIFRT